jgi:hypothetical protein
MPYYAQIDSSGVVSAVTETHSAIDADHMVPVDDLDPSLLGRTYDAETGMFGDPPAPPAQRLITVGAFFDRFGPLKWEILADQSPLVQAVIRDAQVRRHIDLSNSDLPGGLAILQGAGHQIDADAVIDAPVQPHEVP